MKYVPLLFYTVIKHIKVLIGIAFESSFGVIRDDKVYSASSSSSKRLPHNIKNFFKYKKIENHLDEFVHHLLLMTLAFRFIVYVRSAWIGQSSRTFNLSISHNYIIVHLSDLSTCFRWSHISCIQKANYRANFRIVRNFCRLKHH